MQFETVDTALYELQFLRYVLQVFSNKGNTSRFKFLNKFIIYNKIIYCVERNFTFLYNSRIVM
jgi:hypothetical protein